jgi:hypothetical protein
MSTRISRAAAVAAWIVAGLIFTGAAIAFVAGAIRLQTSLAVQARFAADPSCRVPSLVPRPRSGACRLVPGRIIGPVTPGPSARNCPCVVALIALPDGRQVRASFHRRIAVSVSRGIAPSVLLFGNRIAAYYARDHYEPAGADPEMVVTSDLTLTVGGALMMAVFGLPLAARSVRYATQRRRHQRPGA